MILYTVHNTIDQPLSPTINRKIKRNKNELSVSPEQHMLALSGNATTNTHKLTAPSNTYKHQLNKSYNNQPLNKSPHTYIDCNGVEQIDEDNIALDAELIDDITDDSVDDTELQYLMSSQLLIHGHRSNTNNDIEREPVYSSYIT